MGSPGDRFPDIEEDDDGYYQGHLPWAHSNPFEPGSYLGMPKEFIPGRPDADTILPCTGRYAEFADTELVTAKVAADCAGCPARQWCHDWAMANDAWGVWSGLNTEDRAALRRQETKERAA